MYYAVAGELSNMHDIMTTYRSILGDDSKNILQLQIVNGFTGQINSNATPKNVASNVLSNTTSANKNQGPDTYNVTFKICS